MIFRLKNKNSRVAYLPGGKVLGSSVFLVLTLFGLAGCAGLDYSGNGDARQRQAALERLVASQDYHKALNYLDIIAPQRESDLYKTESRRITLLIKDFEADVGQAAAGRAERDDLLGAVSIVVLALKKVPESVTLSRLGEKLRQEQNKRLAENERERLIGEAEYLSSRLAWYEERTRLAKPSLWSRWRRYWQKRSFAALYPDLLACGELALKEGKYDVAEKWLVIAKKVNDSEEVRQLLARIDDMFVNPGRGGARAEIVLISETKKAKPAALLVAMFHELETELKQEIAKGELLKAYDSLAKLEKFAARQEQLKNYRAQLDKVRAERIAAQLEEGSGLYRRGKISEARRVWQQVLVLDPENQTAREKTLRADKVLKSVEDLQKKQREAGGQ